MKDLIAYCGLDCGKCDARRATLTDDSALREKTAKLWSQMNGVEITPEMINCVGCRVDGVKSPYCDPSASVPWAGAAPPAPAARSSATAPP